MEGAEYRKLLGKVVTVQVDRPIGYNHKGTVYPINYGYIPGLPGGDGEEQDAYILGVEVPLETFTGCVVAVIQRHDDCEDRLVAAPEGRVYPPEQIAAQTAFMEQFFSSTICIGI